MTPGYFVRVVLLKYIHLGRFWFRLESFFWMVLFISLMIPMLGISAYFTIPKNQNDLKEDIFYVDKLNFNPKKGQRYGIYGYSEIEKRRLYYRGIPRPDILGGLLSDRNSERRKIKVLYYYGGGLDKIAGRRSVLVFYYYGGVSGDAKYKIQRLNEKVSNVLVFSFLLIALILCVMFFPYVSYAFLRRRGYVK